MNDPTDNIKHIYQNCGADLKGSYCDNCGQSGKAAFYKSMYALISHFFEELFTCDSCFSIRKIPVPQMSSLWKDLMISTVSHWILLTLWIFGTIFFSAVRGI